MAEAGDGEHGNAPDAGAYEFRLLSDEPSVVGDDPLGFDVVAAKLAATILRSRESTPFALGVEGGWGTGKSSLMKRVQTELEADDSVTAIWFNAWSARGSSALEGLIKTVLEQLDPSSLRKAARNHRLIGGLRVAGLILAGLLRIDRVVEVVWQKASVDARTRNELRTVLHDAVESWRAGTGELEPERLLVVFVDDLDRADPTQVFEIFEAIKLYLDTRGFVFVLGYDQAVISDAVLAEKKYSHGVTGRDYVEKIVQVGYRMAPPDDAQAERLMAHYTERSGTAALFDGSARAIVIDRNRRNPRRIKRFLNWFVLRYALDPDWQELGPRRLVEVLLLDMYFPDFMALFWYQAEDDPVTEFLEYHDRRQKVLDRAGETDVDAELRDLERTLPEQYPTWVTQLDFIGLVESLHRSSEWSALRHKLERRTALVHLGEPGAGDRIVEGVLQARKTAMVSQAFQEQPPVLGTDEVAAQGELSEAEGEATYDDGWGGRTQAATAGAATGVPLPPPPWPNLRWQVLWVDDDLEYNRSLMDMLEKNGWEVGIGSSIVRSDGMMPAVDVVIANIDQYGDPDVRFRDLELAHMAGFETPVVFYTGRITPARRERAAGLGAEIAKDPAELLTLLARIRDQAPPRPLIRSPRKRPER